MNFIIIPIAVLFVLAYISRRRFGLLALALVAGTIISNSWASYITLYLQTQGVSLLSPPLSVVVAGVLIILPALLLLLVGPTYHKKWQRAVSSLLFALFAIVLVINMISHTASALLEESSITSLIEQNYPLIITAGIIFALLDTIAAHFPKRKSKKSAH